MRLHSTVMKTFSVETGLLVKVIADVGKLCRKSSYLRTNHHYKSIEVAIILSTLIRLFKEKVALKVRYSGMWVNMIEALRTCLP